MDSELVGSGIGAAGSIIAGIMNYYSQKEANKLNKEMYNQSREDSLAMQKWQQNFAEGQQKETIRESTLGREERKNQTSWNRRQLAYHKLADILNQNMALGQATAAPFQKYAGRQ